MSSVGHREILTQKRVLSFFRDALRTSYPWGFSRTMLSRTSNTGLVDSGPAPAISFLMRRRSFPPGSHPGFAG